MQAVFWENSTKVNYFVDLTKPVKVVMIWQDLPEIRDGPRFSGTKKGISHPGGCVEWIMVIRLVMNIQLTKTRPS
jgi:hypothetical protein